MSASHCPRTWEVEAVRDGRSSAAASTAFAVHAQHCPECAREQRALAALGTRLRAGASAAAPELMLRRVRQNVLAGANRHALAPQPTAAWFARFAAGLGPRVALGALALALVGSGVLAYRTQRAKVRGAAALQLVAAADADFAHLREPQLEIIELRAGSLEISFRRSAHDSLVVRVPDGEIRDFGTVFRVSVQHGRTEEITVREGAVLLRRPGRSDVVIAAGETYRAPALPLRPQRATAPTPDRQDSLERSEAVAAPATRGGANEPGVSAADGGQPIQQPSAARTDHSSTRRRPARPAQLGPAGLRERASPAVGELDEQDRAYLRILALLQDGRRAEARLAAQEYQRDFPAGFRRNEVAAIAAATER
jgi:ferric-dicitrate binding protein FerR (iron transport regulator)